MYGCRLIRIPIFAFPQKREVSTSSFTLLYVCTTFQTLPTIAYMSGLRLSSSVLRRQAAKWPRSNGRIITDYSDYTELLLHTERVAILAAGAGYQEQGAVMYYVICIFWVLQLPVLPIRSMCVSCYLFTVLISLPKYFTNCNNENWETEDVFIG